MRHALVRGCVVLVAGCLPGLPTVPAAAIPPPGAVLGLTIHNGPSTHGPTLARVALRCDPDRGTHPTPAQACDALRRVDGDIPAVPDLPTVCPLIYAPVTAVARGYWYGRRLSFVHTYGNRCELQRDTGPVFTF